MIRHEEIHIDDLIVNSANDRHGQLESEAKAIEWLLTHKANDMKNLAKDIAENGEVLEPPVVMKREDGKYVVYDGNRRIACLKLLLGKAPSALKSNVRDKIQAIYNDDKPLNEIVTCRIEGDMEVINKLLELRHISGQSGAGQVKWGAQEKAAFYERTGQYDKVSYGRQINKILIEEGYLSKDDRIQLAIFQRLFSSKKIRKRVGFDVNNNEITILHKKDEVLKTLSHIAKDIIKGNKKFNDFFNLANKEAYLNELNKKKLLPPIFSELLSPQLLKPTSMEDFSFPEQQKQIKPKKGSLLPEDFPEPKESRFVSKKICMLLREIKYELSSNSHPITMSIVFRSMLEILTRNYMEKNDMSQHKPAKNSNKPQAKSLFECIDEVSKRINENADSAFKLNRTAIAAIKKLSNDKNYESLNTLNEVIHGDFLYSVDRLESLHNNLDSYFRAVIDDLNNS